MSVLTSKPTVWFDGACPLCRHEIDFYRRQVGADQLDWIDIRTADSSALPHGLGKEQLLARFHLRRPDGEMQSGANAFIAIWRALPRFSWLGRLLDNAPSLWVLEGLYRRFLPVRPHVAKLIFACGSRA